MTTFLAILHEYPEKVVYINTDDVNNITLKRGVLTITLHRGFFYEVKNESDVERLLKQVGKLAGLSPVEIDQQPHQAKSEDKEEESEEEG
jgi:hypothetical protein